MGGLRVSIQRARHLRTIATDAERRLWQRLRLSKHHGVHFRRQVPFGRYVADFACHRAKIVVELDGSQHGDEKNVPHDLERTAFLESEGYNVVRVANVDVIANVDGVAEFVLREALERLGSPPDPPTR